MKERNDHINDLLDRFFDGQTFLEEERELYLFFMRDDIPKELIRYKPVIKYFESGLAEESGLTAQRTPNVTTSFLRRRWMVWSGVAASILMILFTSLYLLLIKEPSDPFEGSYIVRNGVHITDINLIRPELETVIQKVLLEQQETELYIEQLLKEDYRVEDELFQQMLKHYDQILTNIQDETIRREVEIILYTNF